jgi:hypothetical protein
VLVSGTPLTSSTITNLTYSPASHTPWDGWIDQANIAYNGGNCQDVPGIVDALTFLNNLTAPSSDTCTGAGNCQVNAATPSIHAECYQQGDLLRFPDVSRGMLKQWIHVPKMIDEYGSTCLRLGLIAVHVASRYDFVSILHAVLAQGVEANSDDIDSRILTIVASGEGARVEVKLFHVRSTRSHPWLSLLLLIAKWLRNIDFSCYHDAKIANI